MLYLGGVLVVAESGAGRVVSSNSGFSIVMRRDETEIEGNWEIVKRD